jgi:hypothetical protein
MSINIGNFTFHSFNDGTTGARLTLEPFTFSSFDDEE